MKISTVSFSSDRKLSRCEMQYHYNYEEKIRPKRKKIGLFRGDLGHQLIEAHYSKYGWEKKFEELKAERWNKLFDEEKEEYGWDFMDTLYELMAHYVDYWSEMDKNWTLVHCEKEFEISTKHGFPIRWKCDLIVSEPVKTSTARRIKGHETNRIILVEHKIKKSIPSSEERVLQPQVHGYAWLCHRKKIPVDKIVWDYIRSEPVPRPKINKNGALSERKIKTDQRGYLKSLQEAGITYTDEADILGLQNTLNALPETLSLERVTNSVNLKMGEEFVRQWVERAVRAKQIEKPLRTWNSNCKFDCDFYLICQVDMIGQVDRKLVLLKSYETKPSREKEELK